MEFSTYYRSDFSGGLHLPMTEILQKQIQQKDTLSHTMPNNTLEKIAAHKIQKNITTKEEVYRVLNE